MSGLKGADNLSRKINRMVGSVQKGVPEIVERGIKIAEAEAKLLAPSNNPSSTEGLRSSIRTTTVESKTGVTGVCYTGSPHAVYVEFGAGPKGEANHAGISPSITPSYTQDPWWVHESQVSKEEAEKYLWFAIETKDGIFYQITGQAAQPFMYPAMKNHEDDIVGQVKSDLKKLMEEAVK